MDFDKALRFLAASLYFLQHLMTRWIPLVVAAPSHGGLRRQGSRAGMELPAGAGANGIFSCSAHGC